MKQLHITPEIQLSGTDDIPPSSYRDLAAMARDLPAALSDQGNEVSVIAAVDNETQQGPGVARRVTPLKTVADGEEREIEVLETRLHPSRARLFMLPLPARPMVALDKTLVPEPRSVRRQAEWSSAYCRAVIELVRQLELKPDIVQFHGEASSLLAVWSAALPEQTPRMATAFYDPQREGVFKVGEFLRAMEVEPTDLSDPEITAAELAVRKAHLVTLPSNGAKRQLMFSRRRNCLKSALTNHPNVWGIMGGLPAGRFDPLSDPSLASPFGPNQLEGKKACKHQLQKAFGMAPRDDTILAIAAPGELPEDGADQLAEGAQAILDQDIQLILTSEGPAPFSRKFLSLASDNKQRMAILPPNELPIQAALAGSDVALASAHWAPWGRWIMAAMRYGAVPVVHAVGGLDDLVTDWDPRTRTGAGFKYRPLNPAELLAALKRAKETFADRANWNTVCANGMVLSWTWRETAGKYEELYSAAIQAETQPS